MKTMWNFSTIFLVFFIHFINVKSHKEWNIENRREVFLSFSEKWKVIEDRDRLFNDIKDTTLH